VHHVGNRVWVKILGQLPEYTLTLIFEPLKLSLHTVQSGCESLFTSSLAITVLVQIEWLLVHSDGMTEMRNVTREPSDKRTDSARDCRCNQLSLTYGEPVISTISMILVTDTDELLIVVVLDGFWPVIFSSFTFFPLSSSRRACAVPDQLLDHES
jgi:hypothetical protein